MMSLIRRAETDPQAFSELYREHVQSVYRYFKSRIDSSAHAEDLTSSVWESVLKNIPHLESDKELVFKAWLFTIARNVLNKFFAEKAKSRIQILGEEHEQIPDTQKTPDELTQSADDGRQLRALVCRLAPEQQECVRLRYYSDLRNKEIAKVLKISEKTVASNLSRALKTIQKQFKKMQ